jgi:predicted Zn-dependent protease
MEFFEYMNRYHSNPMANKYDQTHPLSQERLTAIRNFYNKSKFQHTKHDDELEYRWNRAVAKLKAFTVEPSKILDLITRSSSEEITFYIKAINYFRNSDINTAIKYVDKLIILKPQDPFYHELKGQILFEYGKKEALDSYQVATRLRSDDLLIRLGKAIVGISVYSDDVSKMREFYKDLKFVYDKEPNNITVLYYLTVFYEKADRKAESLLYSAILAYKTGNFDRAKGLAKEAIKGLKKGSPEWHRASDIIILLQK